MKINVVFIKVTENSPEVIALAKALNTTTKAVASTINQDRYRKAYNKVKQARDKQMRAYFKANPNLMPKEVKS